MGERNPAGRWGLSSYQQQAANAAFATPSSAVLERMLVDAYSLIQADGELLGTLIETQREIRKSVSRAALLYARVAGGRAGYDELLGLYNRALSAEHGGVRPENIEIPAIAGLSRSVGCASDAPLGAAEVG